MITPEYAAAYLDAEGCFSVVGQSIAIRVTNTHLGTLEDLMSVYGGGIYNHSLPTAGKRRTFQWCVYGCNAARVMVCVLPFLKEKRIQALLLMEYPVLPPHSPSRAWVSKALSELKRLEYPLISPFKK